MRLVTIPPYYALVTETYGVVDDEIALGGERGARKFLWPWQRIKERVFMGDIGLQILRGDRRLYFAGGPWMDFEEAVATVQIADPLRAVYRFRQEDLDGNFWTGLDGTFSSLRINLNDAVQSFMKGKSLRDAIYISGPEATEQLSMVVPNPNVHPAFNNFTAERGLILRHLRFSGVKLSEKYAGTMEDIALNLERLGVVRQERADILQFLRDLVKTDRKKDPTTLTQAAALLKEIGFAAMLQNMSGQLVVAGGAQMALLWPLFMRMMGTEQQQSQGRGRGARGGG